MLTKVNDASSSINAWWWWWQKKQESWKLRLVLIGRFFPRSLFTYGVHTRGSKKEKSILMSHRSIFVLFYFMASLCADAIVQLSPGGQNATANDFEQFRCMRGVGYRVGMKNAWTWTCPCKIMMIERKSTEFQWMWEKWILRILISSEVKKKSKNQEKARGWIWTRFSHSMIPPTKYTLDVRMKQWINLIIAQTCPYDDNCTWN